MNISMYKKTGLFFGLSTIIPWTLWLLAGYLSHQTSPNAFSSLLVSSIAFLGLLAPVIICWYIAKDHKELKLDFRKRIFNIKDVDSTYIVLTFVLMPMSILLAQAVSLLFGFPIEQFKLAESFSFTSGIFPVWFLLVAAPILEELAWHSYGTDALRSRYSLFRTSMLFALFWGIWHFPCTTIKDYYHSQLIDDHWIYSLNFVLSLFPFVIIMNWIYYKANRNIILPIVFHISAGYFNEIFSTHPMSKVIQTAILSLFAIYIIIHDREFFFSRKIQPDEISIKPAMGWWKSKFIVTGLILGILLMGIPSNVKGQIITQTISGKVFDNITKEPLPFATILIKDSDPLIGAVTAIDGNFTLPPVGVGRHTIEISMVGYDTYEVKELLLSSGQITALEIGLQQSITELGEIVVRVNKSAPLNSMTTVSSRQFSVEETQRYAGGMDDPARLVTSFAGVANPSISDNGISVRGNNPDGLLWRIEGVEVPNPNHFANLTIAGGGLLSAISNQIMSNSDFYTGAFPAEFGNASSGVFDIKLREGNAHQRQYAFEAGLLGVGAMAQGPFNKQSEANYLVNYRYSTMALLAPVLPDDSGILKYQDLAFKTTFPTKKSGTYSFWGIGAIDGVNTNALDSSQWESKYDRDHSQTSMYMFATALSHKINLPNHAFLKTSLAYTGSGLDFSEDRLDYNLLSHPQSNAQNNSSRFVLQSDYTKRFGEKHSNKSGFRYSLLSFNIDVKQSLSESEIPQQISDQRGNSGFMELYSQSKIILAPKLLLNVGVNAQYLSMNKKYSIEPRLGIKYNINSNQTLGFAYGIHSRLEQLSVYFVSVDETSPNKDLEFMKSAHYILSYDAKLSDNLHVRIEPYYQQLSNVPVAPNSYISTLNNNNSLFFDEALVSDGSGHNIGIDITFEKFLSKGFYYMFTASLFDSKYIAADGIERNTRFNRNYAYNLTAGKEWEIGRNNSLSANVRLNYLGGNRKEGLDEVASIEQQDIVYGEADGKLAFSEKFDNLPVLSFTLSYRINKPKFSSVWSLKILNLTGVEEYAYDYYNLKTNQIDTKYNGIIIPNISYKIEF